MAAGLYAGLVRLGLPLPAATELPGVHGPLMICGVFGTLISLERAVAIGLAWPHGAPAGFAVSALLMLLGATDVATFTSLAASLVFLAATVWIAARQPALFTLILVAAAGMLVAGCLAWWLGFLIATIAAERLELSRIIRPGRLSQWFYLLSLVVVVAGAVLGLNSPEGRSLLGVGLTAMAAWLVRYDVATRTVRWSGQPRFMAVSMLAGYLWLAVTGMVLVSGWAGPFSYDLALHGVLIGFVLSMVFGHALIIFPAVARVTLTYRRALYGPLAALHMSVALRVVGDLLELDPLRLASGPLTVLALLGFALTLALRRRVRAG